jgi:hypothetical protein
MTMKKIMLDGHQNTFVIDDDGTQRYPTEEEFAADHTFCRSTPIIYKYFEPAITRYDERVTLRMTKRQTE